MRIIISPAKTMNINAESLMKMGTPVFLEETEKIVRKVNTLSYEECGKLWGCSDELVQMNIERFRTIDFRISLTPAIMAYEGIQYQYMVSKAFNDEEYAYLQEHLRILSGLYGVLKPFDGIQPYRMEMQAKLSLDGKKDLYAFWDRRLYEEVIDASHVIINLASKEYSKTIEKYLCDEDHMINVTFAEVVNGKVRQKATFAKMARGEMVRFMAENKIKDPEGIKAFNALDFSYEESLSDDHEYVFLRHPQQN